MVIPQKIVNKRQANLIDGDVTPSSGSLTAAAAVLRVVGDLDDRQNNLIFD